MKYATKLKDNSFPSCTTTTVNVTTAIQPMIPVLLLPSRGKTEVNQLMDTKHTMLF